MMYEFLMDNRTGLIERCRVKVAQRQGKAATQSQIHSGIPMFLEQLIKTLYIEQGADFIASRNVSGPSGGGSSPAYEMGNTATRHGQELLALGFSVNQVVHNYGDLCQAITDLAFELKIPFLVDEFRTLNRCLDNVIADAVTEFTFQRDIIRAELEAADRNEQLGMFAHELRNNLNTATLAFAATKLGNLSLGGATGSLLENSLLGMSKLIDRSLAQVRITEGISTHHHLFSLSRFIMNVKHSVELDAQAHECILFVADVDPSLGIEADWELLFAALRNLLQNAFKFTHTQTTVSLRAYAKGKRILIDVSDQCGGLPSGCPENLFKPFKQFAKDKSGVGLGLSIARRSVESCAGMLNVRDVPGVGCVFTINLPRYVMGSQSPEKTNKFKKLEAGGCQDV
ncbi:HAMP domain-containing sensor histidine kinase [Paraglaciecola sp.]|uniref:sensor histidine kinase n=1 Tax=Paraglaciecola sp. TaxID=1920173 RepID=UPI0030F49056